MKTWLLTWNPKKFPWNDPVQSFEELRVEIEQIGYTFLKWTVGVNKSIKKGDRIFLMRLGIEPKGIIASGHAITPVFEGTHWDESRRQIGRKARRIYIKLDKMEDFSKGSLVHLTELQTISSRFKWTAQSSGVEIPTQTAEILEHLWTMSDGESHTRKI